MIGMENASKAILISKCRVPDAYPLENIARDLMVNRQTDDLPEDWAKEIMIQRVTLRVASKQAREFNRFVVPTGCDPAVNPSFDALHTFVHAAFSQALDSEC